MNLQDIWFILISVLFTGFFFLEGFDFGVGLLLPFLGKTDSERRQMINTIGPHWDANEVWLITAGGAIFAAFPHWYATMFSGFYLALIAILLGLIIRGVAFEFRSKDEDPRWRRLWDWALFVGSLLPALLWGVAFGKIIEGVPIDGEMHFVGNFFDLLSPYALIAGLAAVAIFALQGAIFLSLKTEGGVRAKAEHAAQILWVPALVISVTLAVANYAYIEIFDTVGVNPGVMPIATAAALLAAVYFVRTRQFGWAFAALGATIVLALVMYFWFLYPNVLVSSLDDAYNLTVDNASSSEYTLQVMSVVALIFVPVMLFYQGWSYWVFRKRVTADGHLEY
ncbi:MAG: cytochrome d ubiquinol oxidase subunit II [Anaerolineae bacterium]|jgi:cytochrome d ubiquinol oxidase subunit II|nr:cytochrome d ubiquinol oxidase subunit II [Anaerolineae bacterium]